MSTTTAPTTHIYNIPVVTTTEELGIELHWMGANASFYPGSVSGFTFATITDRDNAIEKILAGEVFESATLGADGYVTYTLR